MSNMFRLPEADFVAVGICTMLVFAVSLPLVAIVLSNRQPKERVLTIKDQYPDEHLGI
jgi:hypothetical protein